MRTDYASSPACLDWRDFTPFDSRKDPRRPVIAFRMRLPALPFFLAPPSSFAAAAPEAFEVGPEQKSALPGGREADGIIGDFILRNDKIEAVISGNLPLRRANMSTFYGESGITP